MKGSKRAKAAPLAARRAYPRPALDDRRGIERGLDGGESMREIARRLGRPPSTVTREVSGRVQRVQEEDVRLLEDPEGRLPRGEGARARRRGHDRPRDGLPGRVRQGGARQGAVGASRVRLARRPAVLGTPVLPPRRERGHRHPQDGAQEEGQVQEAEKGLGGRPGHRDFRGQDPRGLARPPGRGAHCV
ncbi:helix-turn-helix domain-containing protein [Collinsella tanakaei]|nr:helix-turn-helix domain-containing protein [Collinsella tanakaei]